MSATDIHAPPKGLSRRQALKVVAAAAAVPAVVGGVRLLGPQPSFQVWNGEALGAVASMMIWHSNADFARRTVTRMLTEVARLDRIFSLHRTESELSRLNKDGSIAGASRDLVAVVEEGRAMGLASNGAFDPTVQPLWNLYATHFSSPMAADASGPSAAAVDVARGLIGYQRIDVANRSIAFEMPGMSATLNGIAQGYITDWIADLLRNEGFEHVVVELGETRVLGDHPEGRPWRVGLRDQYGAADRVTDLSDGAVAVSGGYGTVFDPSGRNHHLFDPATGRSADRLLDVVVTAPRATVADALATAVFVAGETRAPSILANYPGAKAILTRHDGTAIRV
ncbi:MAG: FAD:protein FMN transferase [Alphaproteobacteria bacterium]